MSLDADHSRAFRRALGSFATGVTIATTLDKDGRPVGVTASSFNSVSLDPPLVLWSLAKDAFSREAFTASGHFAIHVLAASQEALSDRFARSGTDKFAGLEWASGELGSPLFPHFAARFECRLRHEYEGGDHLILVGEVIDFEAHDVAPLLFHAGRYADRHLRATEASDGEQPADPSPGLLALVARIQAGENTGEDRSLEIELAREFSPADIATARRILVRLAELSTRA